MSEFALPSVTAQVVAREYLLETTAPMVRQAGWHETAAAIESAACSGLLEVVVDSVLEVVAGISDAFIATNLARPSEWRFVTVDLAGHVGWWAHEVGSSR